MIIRCASSDQLVASVRHSPRIMPQLHSHVIEYVTSEPSGEHIRA
jgi:hypothetical protein